ncbi:gluconate 2-dehydrogenase subunit 3 family protein [Shimazuella sp. AN120528]|uniref:gluconate 2-dehydrogenase subunit 3 family protein n=1 Tax=Shimazuella soli TaxID=1892854 RepID=UPI001F0E1086|nr:gluconate 2-dehydrogenase subunit 3 family protein [Shimazuella soli]MCH5586051.1 gluconate 2-dehydrogenase subunit 3 family protein [Shimazuella soli]
MSKRSHYPSYDVMKAKDEWDDHTQQIVSKRLEPTASYSFLTKKEAAMLQQICGQLTGDERESLIFYILDHMDQTLHSSIGEGQRKVGAPKAKELLRSGLEALEQTSQEKYELSFVQLDKKAQQQLLTQLSKEQAFTSKRSSIPQKELFKKLLTMTLEAYYSHPLVWSEIGYGGPAYPRGYVRTQLGQLDPWEAQPEDE